MNTPIDACKIVFDLLKDLGLPIYLFSAPQDTYDKITINFLPGSENQITNEIFINVNIMVNKIGGSIDSSKLNNYQKLVESALKSFSGDQSRVTFAYFRFENTPTIFSTWNDSNFAYLNNRISLIFNSN